MILHKFCIELLLLLLCIKKIELPYVILKAHLMISMLLNGQLETYMWQPRCADGHKYKSG